MLKTVVVTLAILTTLPDRPMAAVPIFTETIHSNSGPIRGEVLDAPNNMAYSRFLGVRYASPPLGELRFEAPRPHVGWRQVKDAVEFGMFCPQDVSSWRTLVNPEVLAEKMEKSHKVTHEDCLYLDIYVPGRIRPRTLANEGLSVLVWFHGGGFENGTSMLYSLETLATTGNVIVVGVNYRLGALGFLSLGREIGGNFGLLDQRLALKWIQTNIEFFGGNKNKVTIFGTEAGGASVALHVLSQRSKNLFKRAISQSGVALSYYMFREDPKEAYELTQLLAAKVGCSSNETRRVAQCMRRVDVEAILLASKDVRRDRGTGFLPVVDENFLKQRPLDVLRDSTFNKVSDYLIGVNSDEGYAFYSKLFKDFPGIEVSQELLNYQIKESLKKEYVNNVAKASQTAAVEYGTCSQNSSQRAQALVQFLGDYNIIAPSYRMAHLVRKSGVNVYFYEFKHRPSSSPVDVPGYVVADHGAEVDFLFGHTHFQMTNTTDEEKILSRAMMLGWSNFARTGSFKPATDVIVYTQPFSIEQEHYLQITTRLTQQSVKTKFRAQRMSFWNDYLPKMRVSEACVPVETNEFTDPTAQLEQDLASTRASATGLTVFVVLLIIIIIILVLIIIVPRCRSYRKRHREDTEHDQDQERGRCACCDGCAPDCHGVSARFSKCYHRKKVYSPRKEGEEAENRMLNDTRDSDMTGSDDMEKQSLPPPPSPLPSATSTSTHTTV